MNRLFFANLVTGTLLFDRFELVRCLSAGHIGGVYLCNDKSRANKPVALKVLSTSALNDEQLVSNFQKEVQISHTVNHPQVVQAKEYFRDEEFTAFTMEYVEGGTLADYIASKPNLEVSDILAILNQLAEGLRAIHKAGIIHRDLKPENILIDKAGKIKITDFSIAVNGSSSDSNLEEEIIGTINYLSPEYIQRGEFDQRSDIYAFGVIAYELMTGKLPFYGDSVIDTLTSRVRFDPHAPCNLRPDISRPLSDLALKAMRRNPVKRYQNIEEVLEHLQAVQRLENLLLEVDGGEERQISNGILGRTLPVATAVA